MCWPVKDACLLSLVISHLSLSSCLSLSIDLSRSLSMSFFPALSLHVSLSLQLSFLCATLLGVSECFFSLVYFFYHNNSLYSKAHEHRGCKIIEKAVSIRQAAMDGKINSNIKNLTHLHSLNIPVWNIVVLTVVVGYNGIKAAPRNNAV